MNPSQRNTDAGASGKDAVAARLTNWEERHDPPTDSGFQSSIPSAPVLPTSPYNPEMTALDPPSYESVVAQDASPQVAGNPPYPTAPIPMPGPVATGRQIVFAAPVSVESYGSYFVGIRYPAGHGQRPSHDLQGNRRRVRVTFAVLVLTFATIIVMVFMYR